MQGVHIPDKIRTELKRPFGLLLQEEELIARLRKAPGVIISVGDIATLLLLERGIIPDISFFDYICKRERITKEQRGRLDGFKAEEIKVRNPPGMLTEELMDAIKKILSQSPKYPVKVIVEGEEDLAVLPAVIYAPVGTLIIYGQPNEGVVLIELNAAHKKRAQNYIEDSEVVQ